MIHIAICDDEQEELEKVLRLLSKYTNQFVQCEIKINSFLSALELLTYVEKNGGFDILLIDIYMSAMLGTDVAKELRHRGDDVAIIFLTTSREHSLYAFEVDAAQYLIKPYLEENLFAALGKVVKYINVEKRARITLKTASGMIRLAPRDVVFTETARKNYQYIHTIEQKTFEVRMSSTEIFELLSQNKWLIRCGASLNLNLKYIRQISKNAITFDTGACITYPYRLYNTIKDEFLHFQMSEYD